MTTNQNLLSAESDSSGLLSQLGKVATPLINLNFLRLGTKRLPAVFNHDH